jgi:ATP-dependent DNA helicase PIF1
MARKKKKPEIKLTESQKEALEALESGKNIFLTGEAGTGKSYLLRHFVTKLKDKNVLLTAPTGIASLNIGGATLHRTFRLPIDVVSIKEDWIDVPDVVRSADILIVDEISMCRIDIFERVLKTIKKANRQDMQIVLVGDFFQLPPVVGKEKEEKKIFKEFYGDKVFPFESELWTEFNFVTKKLKEVVRQSDLEFIENLNKARYGDKSCISYFNELENEKTESPIEVCPTNKQADFINNTKLRLIDDYREQTYRAREEIYRKNFRLGAGDKVVPDNLTIKREAKVILCVNLAEKGVFNGQIGVVKDFDDTSVLVDFDGKMVEIERYEWVVKGYEADEDGKPYLVDLASYRQIPLKLAFAITIHKAQGQTFKSAVIHPDTWLAGQLYVALSRVADSKGLYLSKQIAQKNLIADQKVLDFYTRDEEEKELEEAPAEPEKIVEAPKVPQKAGRKRKFSGLDTRTVRLPVVYIDFVTKLCDCLATIEADEKYLEKILEKIK